MKNYSLLVVPVLGVLVMTGCSTTPSTTTAPVPSIVTVTVPALPTTVIVTTTPATTPPTKPTAPVTALPQTCSATVKGLSVGACVTGSSTEQVLAACHRARDAWVSSIAKLAITVDPADAKLCATSVSLSGNGVRIMGLPDQRALPDGWPSSDTKSWYIGSFEVSALNQARTKAEKFYYLADGRPMTAGQLAIYLTNMQRFQHLR